MGITEFALMASSIGLVVLVVVMIFRTVKDTTWSQYDEYVRDHPEFNRKENDDR